jgi:formylglycine-generating enzyme required for sulfatase activity
VNLLGAADGYAWTAPVDSMPCGRSPYGIFHLGGNLQEWISREGQIDRANPMRILRGGACDAPLDMDLTTSIFRNPRVPRTADYSLGFRCVIDEADEIP